MITHNNILFVIYILSLVLGVVTYDYISNMTGFTYIDELFLIVLIAYWLICVNKSKCSEFFIFALIALGYLFYSFLYPNNVNEAILMDFFIQVKPFIAFYTLYAISYKFSEKQNRIICKLCMAIAVVCFSIGILDLMGQKAMLEYFGHSSRFATTCQILGMSFFIFSKDTTRNRWISFTIICVSAFSFRSKAYGFIALFGAMTIFYKYVNFRRLVNIKNILVFCLATIVGWYFASDKFIYYFVDGANSVDIFARPALYKGAYDILQDHLLLGSGFGSFAEYASSVYYSPLYIKYHLNYVYGLSEDMRSFISDTYFPSLAQYGLIGIILYIYFWYKRIRIGRTLYSFTSNKKIMEVTILILFFFIIESIADSTFTQNRGMFMMMLLASVQTRKFRIKKNCL